MAPMLCPQGDGGIRTVSASICKKVRKLVFTMEVVETRRSGRSRGRTLDPFW
jgi:hypothetical protein